MHEENLSRSFWCHWSSCWSDVHFLRTLTTHLISKQILWRDYLSLRKQYYSKWLKYYFLIKISQITSIVIEQVFLCFKMWLKKLAFEKCFNIIRLTRVNSSLSGSCFQRMVFFTRSYQRQWKQWQLTTSHSKPYQDNQNTVITILSDTFLVKCIFVRLCLSPANPFSCKFNQWIFPRSYLTLLSVKEVIYQHCGFTLPFGYIIIFTTLYS